MAGPRLPARPGVKPQGDNVQRLLDQASAQWARRDSTAAVATYRRILAAHPTNFAALVNFALVLAELGQRKEAEALYRRAITAQPRRPEPHYNLGELFRQAGRHEEAKASYDAALDCRPEHTKAMFGRMLTLRSLRRFDEAQAACAQVLELEPDHLGALYQRLKMAQHRGDFEDAARTHRRLDEVLPHAVPASKLLLILTNIAYVQLFSPWRPAVSRLLSDRLAELLGPPARSPVLAPTRPLPPAGRQLRIGYLSPNWGNHPVGHVTRSFFQRHDRERVEIFGYSAKDRGQDRGIFHGDLAKSFDHYVDVTGIPPQQAARRIAQDRIDVLIDLDGFMDMVAPPIMAYRPAPVQVFWLGHAGGLGLPFIDYLIADHRVVRDEDVTTYREAVVRVPGVYHPADLHPVDAATPTRASEGLPDHGIVFCAFNNPQKIDGAVFAAWMRILAAVPGSVLWLTNHNKHADPKPTLRAAAAAAGVDPARLIFAGHRPDKRAHLARHRCADLFLDTFAMNAATTALDAMSVGLPVLTRPGARFGERMATSFVVELGCEELICESTESYVARAIELAGDPQQRAKLRRNLETAVTAGRLFDSTPLARALERAYVTMIERAAEGLKPAAFDVPA